MSSLVLDSSGLWLMPAFSPRTKSIACGINSCSFIASWPAPLGMRCSGRPSATTARSQRACQKAELALYLEKRAAAAPNLVGTMGILTVPNGSTNVVPGRCQFTLDIRATTDPVRDACAADVLARLKSICERRGLSYRLDETMRAAAAPCAPDWQQRWARSVEATGLPAYRMPSGAGHDAMKLHEAMPQAMLFVRGENAGISHNPLESSTNHDIQLAVEAYTRLLEQLAAEAASPSARP